MPGRICTICTHAERSAIDAAIVAGASCRDIAGRYGVSKTAVSRHAGDHLPATLAQAQAATEVAQADDLLSQVRGLQAKTLDILRQAEAGGDLRTALAAIREARENVLLFAKLEAFVALPQTIVEVAYPSAWANAFEAVDAGAPVELLDAPAKPRTVEEALAEMDRKAMEQQRQEEQRQQEEHAKRIADFLNEPATDLWIA